MRPINDPRRENVKRKRKPQEHSWTVLVIRSKTTKQLALRRLQLLILLLHPFNGLFSGTTWVSRYQEGKTSLDLNEARDDGVLGCDAVASAGPYANKLHLAPDR